MSKERVCAYINLDNAVKNMEGFKSGNWILMDYGDVVVHLFTEEDREFYDLERIWRDGIDISKEDLGI